MRTPKQTDPQFKLRLTPEVDSAIEAAALAAGRTKNAEILIRLEQSLALPPLDLAPDLLQRMQKAPASIRATRGRMLVDALSEFFPAPPSAKRGMSPEQFFDAGLALMGDAPEEERPRLMSDLVAMMRKMTKNPKWQPPDGEPE